MIEILRKGQLIILRGKVSNFRSSTFSAGQVVRTLSLCVSLHCYRDQ